MRRPYGFFVEACRENPVETPKISLFTLYNLHMCGRYRLGRGKQAFVKVFGVSRDDIEWEPRFNIAPTQLVPTVRQDTREPIRRLSLMRWGLIPSWAKDPSIGSRMINARSETAASRPAFAEALQRRRCLIPADGFYEWQRALQAKRPFCFTFTDDSLFAFAGIWDRWRDAESRVVESCSILTTGPNSVTADVHNRMPVILKAEEYDLWLDPGLRRIDELLPVLLPFDGALMKKHPVSTHVNSVTNDDSRCAEPIQFEVPVQKSILFS